jgi:hypothetical protein
MLLMELNLTPLEKLDAFNIEHSTVTLWVFKKVLHADSPPTFTGRWVQTTEELEASLKEAVSSERERITEVQEFSLLAQTNESSALSISTIETHAGLIVDQTGNEVVTKKASSPKHLFNSIFYVVKMVHESDVIYAVRKTPSSWHTKRAKGLISVVFRDHTLTLDGSPSFDISRDIDFFIIGDEILVSKKMNFESVLSYKQAHQDDFAMLQGDPSFSALFLDMQVFTDYVGQNKINLRRVTAIHQKGHYKNKAFMDNLRKHYKTYRLNLSFDKTGRIITTPETCKDVMQALLDHRLFSAFSNSIYDVQDTTSV